MVVNGIASPSASSGPPSSPRRPNTSSSASPATDGGSTIGRSMIASIQPLPRNERRARSHASGSPRATLRARLIAVVDEAQRRARRARPRDVRAVASEPSMSARATSARTGSPRNSGVRPATTATGRPPSDERAPPRRTVPRRVRDPARPP